ncbi:ferritin-like domain-containing protein [Nitrosophilus kaiyonis]|uniref:ferritin-like domain-containing protein n=1 Tax=Nitrosophilus kaiyonis TaxID=2930200 RepID=UPI00249043B3|nr:ferritin-like domain-containing protein [Nitrosophilus kaiyonis]
MRWNYKEIDYEKINKKALKDNEFLFYLITSASFIEITSHVYEKNLKEFYKGDESLIKWLENVWEPEEIQHGKALKKFVNSVWKDFDWDSAYKRFLEDYLPHCTLEEFQPTKAKEMLARMVVETGTSTFYRAIENYSKDLDTPILAQISRNISKDEVYHYDIFEEAYQKYNKIEKLKKDDIIKVIYNRLKMVDGEDAKLAFKAIYEEKNLKKFEDKYYEEHKKNVGTFAKKYYPYNMAIKMLLRPLNLNKTIEKLTIPVIKGALKILGI